jgi:hypothetical protein
MEGNMTEAIIVAGISLVGTLAERTAVVLWRNRKKEGQEWRFTK